MLSPMLHDGGVGASFSPDGRVLLTLTDSGSMRLWDAATAQPLTETIRRRLHAPEFSGDGRLIVSASFDGSAYIFDAQTGNVVTPPLRHTDAVWAARFSPDNRRVVTGSDDRTARIWDAYTGWPLTPPLKHRARVSSVAFSPDGQRIATGCGDGTARIWEFHKTDLPTEDLQLLAQLLSGRRLDANLGLTALTPQELRNVWEILRDRHPKLFQ